MARMKLWSAAGAAEGQLKAGAKKIRGQLVTVEKAAEKLASDVKAELPGVGRRLKEATTSVTKRKSPRRTTPAAAAEPAQPAPSPAGGPDDSWTVADLRAEAKKRGMTGYSRKTKSELLADLRR
jgi:lysophospholipase